MDETKWTLGQTSARHESAGKPDTVSSGRGETKNLVCELDRSHGREPDQRSENLASVLVVSARNDGMSRIDQLVLSDDASRVWAVERPPGVQHNLFNKDTSVPTVDSLNTSMERSAAQWPASMHSFEVYQQAEAQTKEQVQFQSQSSPQVPQGRPFQR